MSCNHKIIWTHAAEQDLRMIIDCVEREKAGNGKKVLKKIRKKAGEVFQVPEDGKVVPELHSEGIHLYREFSVEMWRIIYRLENKKVNVLCLFDGRQNVEDILLQRLVRKT